DSRRKVFGEHRPHVLVQPVRVVVRGKRVVIRDEEEAFRIVLHSDEIVQRPEVVPQMELSGRPDAAEYYIHVPAVTVFGDVIQSNKSKAKKPDISHFYLLLLRSGLKANE